jgi:N-acetylglucosamine kinase-like BadF-type ATPase
MKRIFLGVDIGSSTSTALLCDEAGEILSFSEAGPGNHEVVGYDGLQGVLQQLTAEVLQSSGIDKANIYAAGFGISGFDWPSERGPTWKAIRSLGLTASIEFVNDTLLGLIAGTDKGWGIVILAGSGENCWGRDPHGRIGRMTGLGPIMGEYGGGSTIVAKAVQAISAEWSQRGPKTSLTRLFLETTGARDIDDLIIGLSMDHYHVGAETAPKIFQAAEQGDAVAYQIIQWAAEQLANLVLGVVHQLDFQFREFDIVEMGGVFKAGALLTNRFHAAVLESAQGAHFLSLEVPPVVGAVLLAAEKTGADQTQIRKRLIAHWKHP